MNRKEVNKYIRFTSKESKEGQCCSLCGLKRNIEQHHLIKVKELGSIAWRNGYDSKEKIDTMYIPTTFICNKCHELVHSLMDDNYEEPTLDLNFIEGILELISDIDLTNVQEDLIDDYEREVNKMFNMMLYNFVKYGDLTSEELDYVQEIIELQLGDEYSEVIERE